MKNQELFNRTVAILVKAYQNEALVHSECRACAVGNMVAAAKGIKLTVKNGAVTSVEAASENSEWYNCMWNGSYFINNYVGAAKDQVDITGYKIDELCKIEYAFENYPEADTSDDEGGFLGLMSVVDALILIHEATTEEATEAKELFVKA